ncbi:MAG: hypothetical protein IMZ53_01920 [Thermoplasmata archaeon]|nr:hypothetical protein [Thermoplasmata archaeon]
MSVVFHKDIDDVPLLNRADNLSIKRKSELVESTLKKSPSTIPVIFPDNVAPLEAMELSESAQFVTISAALRL